MSAVLDMRIGSAKAGHRQGLRIARDVAAVDRSIYHAIAAGCVALGCQEITGDRPVTESPSIHWSSSRSDAAIADHRAVPGGQRDISQCPAAMVASVAHCTRSRRVPAPAS